MPRSRSLSVVVAAALVLGGISAVPAVAADASTVTVTVTSSSGAALAGAVVELRGAADENGESAEQERTNAAGTVTFDDVHGRDYVLFARPDGYLPTYYGNTVRTADARVLTVVPGKTSAISIVAKRGATVTGRVLDAAGKGVAGLTVWATNTHRQGDAYATTSATGRYVLHGLASGAVVVSTVATTHAFNDDGASWAGVTVAATAQQGATTTAPTIKLGSAKITGKIAYTGSTWDKPEATLVNSKGAVVANVGVTPAGKVTFSRVKAGTYRVVLTGANQSTKVTVKTGKRASFGTITRGKRTTLKGVVRNSADHAVAWAGVYLFDANGTLAGSTWTNAKGSYSIKGLVRGTYSVRVQPYDSSKHSGAAFTVTAKPGHNVVKNLKLSLGSTVTGYVKHDGKGVAGIRVNVGGPLGKSAVTDAAGKYRLIGVAPGKATVHVFDASTGGYRNASAKVVVKKGTSLKVATIAVK